METAKKEDDVYAKGMDDRKSHRTIKISVSSDAK